MIFQTRSRACLKNAFCQMCVTICGRFDPNEGGVAGYVDRMRAKYTAKWGVQLAGMIFQTRSRTDPPGTEVSGCDENRNGHFERNMNQSMRRQSGKAAMTKEYVPIAGNPKGGWYV